MESLTTTTWYVCHGTDDVIHFIELEPGSVFETGQPNVETFDNETDAIARAEELGYDFNPEEDTNLAPEPGSI